MRSFLVTIIFSLTTSTAFALSPSMVTDLETKRQLEEQILANEIRIVYLEYAVRKGSQQLQRVNAHHDRLDSMLQTLDELEDIMEQVQKIYSSA